MSFAALKYLWFFLTIDCFEFLVTVFNLRLIPLDWDVVPSVELQRFDCALLRLAVWFLFLAQMLIIELPISAAVMLIWVLNLLCFEAIESLEDLKWLGPVVEKKFLMTSEDLFYLRNHVLWLWALTLDFREGSGVFGHFCYVGVAFDLSAFRDSSVVCELALVGAFNFVWTVTTVNIWFSCVRFDCALFELDQLFGFHVKQFFLTF